MELVGQALRAGVQRVPAAGVPARAVLVAGAGGALGSEVLERLLGAGGLFPVRVLATQPFHATVRGLEVVQRATLSAAQAAPLAVVVFDRERHANGRDEAFLRPDPAELPALAAQLHAVGVRNLLVVMPHAAASLPEALRAGLASLDEQSVASLGFDRLAILRSARAPDALASRGLQRVADTVLAQLRMMTPQHQQPLRSRKVAQIAVEAAKRLADAPPGTRVLAPERVWQAAQQRDPGPLVDDWLHGRPWPPLTLRPGRM
jgi:hypothetical protein